LDLSLPVAFTVGLFSTLHCVGMCGGIMGALSYGLPPELRARSGRFALFILAYNLGRILSYAVGGAAIGGLGATLLEGLHLSSGHLWLRWAAGLIMVGIGLHIAGWFPQFARVERLGAPVWRRLEPLGRRLMPVQTLGRAFVYGAVWGWLPCGLVYTMLLTAATQGAAVEGALFMAFFGVGTLPTMMVAGFYVGHLSRVARKPLLKQFIGLSVVLMGILTMLSQGMEPPIAS